MLSAEQLQMRLPIHVSHQNAEQLLWKNDCVKNLFMLYMKEHIQL